MIIKGSSYWFVIILLISGMLHAGNDFIKVQSQSSSSLAVQASFPEPQKRSEQDSDGAIQVHYELPGMQLRQQESYAVVPYTTKLFSLSGKNFTYQVKSLKSNKIQLGAGEQFTVFHTTEVTATPQKQDLVEITYLGLFRDVPLYSLTFFPLRYDPANHSVEYISDLQIEITGAGSLYSNNKQSTSSQSDRQLNAKLLLNSNYSTAKPPVNITETTANTQKFKQNRYKILIDQTGLYQISYDDLVAQQVPVDQLDTRRLKISCRGLELPIYFKGGADGRFDPGDYFEFWGEINRSPITKNDADVYNDPFSDINIYWMETGETTGLRMVEESGTLAESNPAKFITPYAFKERIHFEEDNSFVRFGHESADIDSAGYTMDHWFYDRGVSAVSSRSYEADLVWPFTDIGSRSVFVKAMMRGLSTKSTSNPLNNHSAEIWLNDAKVAESGNWTDQHLKIITNEGQLGIPQSAIKHGDNQLRVVMDQTGVTDIALLNWFEIEYLRRYRADNDFIKFRKQANIPDGYIQQFEVDGFKTADIELYKLGISKMVNNRIDYITATDNYSSYRITFQDEIFYSDIEYIAISPSAKKKPITIKPDLPWKEEVFNASLYDGANRAEYVIITDKLYYENVKRLKAYREQKNGLAVEIVLVEDIYDEFNHGIKSPLAIKKFLKYAFNNWDASRRLMYVVLVGSASFDYKEKHSAKDDQVPTFLFETFKYGASGSDYPYTLVSGSDDVPDLIVSRIPVANNSEFNNYMEKIEGYEASENTGEWQQTGLFISGNDGSTNEVFSGKPAFRVQNQRLIDLQMPAGYFSRKLTTIQDTTRIDPNFGGTNDLIDYFDDGLSVVNFFGHGGGGIWADVQLMNTTDIDRLSEHFRLPFIQSMTCFTGAYENGSINGLADKLLLAPRKGAIGVLAASGVGWLYNDFAFSWNITDHIFGKDLNIGEAVLFGKILYLHNNSYVTEAYDTSIPSYGQLRKSMVNHYNLLGDPYIKLKMPEKNLAIKLDNYLPLAGDTLVASLQAAFSSGNGRIELTNELHEKISEYYFNMQGGSGSINIAIPADLDDQILYIKGYASDDFQQNESRGFVKFAINKALIDSVITSPRAPKIGDFINFSVYLKSPQPVARVVIKNIRAGNGGPDELDLKYVNNNIWIYDQGFGPYTSSDTVYFDIELTDSVGTKYISRRHRLAVLDPRPDVQIMPGSLEFSGSDQIELRTKIYNKSSTALADVNLAFYLDSYGKTATSFSSLNLNLEPYQKSNISIPVAIDLTDTRREFFAVLDGPGMIEESNEVNNIQSKVFPENLYFFLKEVGTTHNGTSNDTLKMGSFGQFHMAANSMTASSVFTYDLNSSNADLELDTQPGFKYINFFDVQDTVSLTLQFHNDNADFIKAGHIEIEIDTNRYNVNELPDFNICRYYPDISRWVALNTGVSDNKLFTEIVSGGEYAVFAINDFQKPVIEITVNGRNLTEGMYIPKNPSLAFILQDENGIDLNRGFTIMVDNDSIPSENIILPDSLPNANAVSVLSTPNISEGPHTLGVQVKDVNGNVTQRTVNFVVASDFDLRVFGNYPNPFEDQTIISFEIVSDGILEQFSVKIYTVSGRKIREITRNEEYPDEIWSPGYHEIEWDGLDNDRNLVANGVYFAVVSAKYKGKTVEHTLKLAKLK